MESTLVSYKKCDRINRANFRSQTRLIRRALCRDGHEPNTIIIIKLVNNVTTHRSIDLEAHLPLRSRIAFRNSC